jgi:hypothetical protein
MAGANRGCVQRTRRSALKDPVTSEVFQRRGLANLLRRVADTAAIP